MTPREPRVTDTASVLAPQGELTRRRASPNRHHGSWFQMAVNRRSEAIRNEERLLEDSGAVKAVYLPSERARQQAWHTLGDDADAAARLFGGRGRAPNEDAGR